MTEDEFPCENYPDFLSGFGYLIPKKTRDLRCLFNVSFRRFFSKISMNLFFRGILPDYLSLERHPMPGYSIRYEGNCENFFDNPKSFACAAGLHHGDTSDVFDKFNRYWQQVRKSL